MPQYLISFNDGAMDHISAEDLPDVGKASHAVVQEAVNAGVWVYGGGLERQRASIVATDGMVTDGPYPETKEVVGGFRSSTWPPGRRRWRGLPRSPPLAAARKRSGSSWPTPKQTRCSARPTGITATTERPAERQPPNAASVPRSNSEALVTRRFSD